ncbi:lipopolysaccharide assembly protein LapA domain-containing protein [Dermabacter sp. p3-SID358]|uniref:LapA family protein n=1 Tax=Dermabacter sp. p3-SID358 TaxID=2916114 RepID=UPI0021A7BBC5|nr:lipopolysaccharide assembly protein LapA domain-containing protein [Dermabacter sp. p3-SID358]MCT1867733.1 lipopolysaccharide assembly protein LapA domain-containing protein [Dermabacter sp. p3-SID358]
MNTKEYDGFSDSFRDAKAEDATRANPAGAGLNNAGTTASSAQAAPKAPGFGGAAQTSDPKSTSSAPAAQANPTTQSAARPNPRTSQAQHTQNVPKPAPSAAPQNEQHSPQPAPKSRMAVVWASLIVGAILLILLLVFIIQNNVATQFEYFTWQFNLPLGVAMLLAAIAGALIMALAGSVRMIQMGWELHKYRRDRK